MYTCKYYNIFKGAYVFIETSSPAKSNDNALLISPSYQPGKDRCVTFWYHMYGAGTGTLNVIVKSPNNKKSAVLWTMSNNKGDKWLSATVPISASDWTQDYQV